MPRSTLYLVFALMTAAACADQDPVERCLAEADTSLSDEVRSGYVEGQGHTRLQAASHASLRAVREALQAGRRAYAVVVDGSCPAAGLCRPDTVTFGLAISAFEPRIGQPDSLYFRLAPGATRLAAPVDTSGSEVREPTGRDSIVAEHVEARLAYADMERIACADSATVDVGSYRQTLSRDQQHRTRNLLKLVRDSSAVEDTVSQGF